MSRLGDARLKVERTAEHLKVLDNLIAAYFDSEPYATFHEYSPDDPDMIRGIGLTKEPPADIALVAADCAQNLRAALDYVFYELSIPDGGEMDEKVMFPIRLGAPRQRQRRTQANQRHIPASALAIIEEVQPYQAGKLNAPNHPLWLLNELAKIGRHRRLYLTNAYASGADLVYERLPPELFGEVGLVNVGKEGETVARTFWFPKAVPSDTDMKMYLKGTLFVVLEEEGGLRGAAINYLLRQCVEFVKSRVIARLDPAE